MPLPKHVVGGPIMPEQSPDYSVSHFFGGKVCLLRNRAWHNSELGLVKASFALEYVKPSVFVRERPYITG